MWTWNDGTELYHHGILGQKWGHRNGPPYPLDAKRHSASEKKAGWRKSLNKDLPESSQKKFKLTDKQKKALIIGSTAAAAALLVIGGVYLHRSGALNNLIIKGKDFTGLQYDQESDGYIDSSLTSKNLSTIHKIVSKMNPTNNRHNCNSCFAAIEANRRGIPVNSIDRGKHGIKTKELMKAFKGYNPKWSKSIGVDDEEKAKYIMNYILSNAKEGDRGSLGFTVKTKGIAKILSMNHNMHWEILNGNIILSDGQNKRMHYDHNEILSFITKHFYLNNFSYGIVSDCEIIYDELYKITEKET